MKKLIPLLCTFVLVFCLSPFSAFADGDNAGGLLEKMNSQGISLEGDTLSAKELYNMTAPKVVEILTRDIDGYDLARGSGFFIDANGTIVTNFHVIEDAASAQATTYDGSTYEVTSVLGYDSYLDLAILRISLTGNPYLEMPSVPVETGDTIYTLGSSLGLTGTFSDGLVSTSSRVIDDVDYIQITAPISHGNSGGPLINTLGEVIGVNTWAYTDGQNINFAVNIHELARLDISSPMTMPEFYEKVASQYAAEASNTYDTSDPDIAEWYEESDLQEIESNDSFDWSDYLRNGYIMAGSIEGVDDFDYFNIKVVAETDVIGVLMPMYLEDNDYLIMGLADEEGNILGYSEPTEFDEENIGQYMEVHIEDPGTYYMVLCVSDDYPYSDPSYYQLFPLW